MTSFDVDGGPAVPRLVTSVPGPRSLAWARDLRRVESPNVTYVGDGFPIFWQSASGSTITDVDGNILLDMTSAFGVAAVGHCHPRVVEAVQRQAALLMHGMGDVHPSAIKVDLCREVANRVPISDARVILGQNGSDAVEAALKTARLATGRPGVVAFEGAYHGLSYGALNVTSRADFRDPFLDQLGAFVIRLPFGCPPDQLATALVTSQAGAVLVEPIQGRGGIVVPPEGWLAGIADCCRDNGALFICDEIFTGWGRTGQWFGCDYEDVVPDILCVGKAMGGGLPISACVASAPVMSCWGESKGEALHTSTFLGNPLCCAAALAAIHVIAAEDLPARAVVQGRRLVDRLRQLRAYHPDLIVDVRGRGLMLGLQCASPALALDIVRRALAAGLILLPAGDGSVIELVPPLTISDEEVDTAVSILDGVMGGEM
ncbi:MAG: aspartate aminotransferase family protein [Capsulimonadaceae bacterium]